MLSLNLGLGLRRVIVVILTVLARGASGVGGGSCVADTVVGVGGSVGLVGCVLVVLLLLEAHKCFVGGAPGDVREA